MSAVKDQLFRIAGYFEKVSKSTSVERNDSDFNEFEVCQSQLRTLFDEIDSTSREELGHIILSFPAVVKILEHVDIKSSHVALNASKCFSIVSEVVLNTRISQANMNLLKEKLEKHCLKSVFKSIINFVVHGSLIHDSFHHSFLSALELSSSDHLDSLSNEQIREILQFIICSIKMQITTLPNVLGVRKAEALVGFLNSIFEILPRTRTYRDYTSTNSRSQDDVYYEMADNSIAIIVELVKSLKASVVHGTRSAKSFIGTEPEVAAKRQVEADLRELKLASSEARKGSIATALSIITTVPVWVVYNQSALLSLSLEHLGTPALFAASYVSLKQAGNSISENIQNSHGESEDSVDAILVPDSSDSDSGCSVSLLTDGDKAAENEYSKPSELVPTIISYLKTSLLNIPKYSFTAARDIIDSITELLEHQCVELFGVDSASSLSMLLLQAYTSQPKIFVSKKTGTETTDTLPQVLALHGLF